MTSLFKTMSQIDVTGITEKKNNFTYLSWAHAYRILKEHCPQAEVTKHLFQQKDGTVLPYMEDNAGYAYVQVTVKTQSDITTEIMPVLNHSNKPLQCPDSFAVNASLQRCMAKAISMATGLGLHLYAGEDTPSTPTVSSPIVPQAPMEVPQQDNPIVKAVQEQFAGATVTVRPTTELKKLDTSILVSLEAQLEACKNVQQLWKLFETRKDWTADQKSKFTARKQEIM